MIFIFFKSALCLSSEDLLTTFLSNKRERLDGKLPTKPSMPLNKALSEILPCIFSTCVCSVPHVSEFKTLLQCWYYPDNVRQAHMIHASMQPKLKTLPEFPIFVSSWFKWLSNSLLQYLFCRKCHFPYYRYYIITKTEKK